MGVTCSLVHLGQGIGFTDFAKPVVNRPITIRFELKEQKRSFFHQNYISGRSESSSEAIRLSRFLPIYRKIWTFTERVYCYIY
jgi:hypothetical protein